MTKAFPNVQALTDVSLDVRPGEILALLGENGAGKSTLLKILNGDYQPDAGTMSVDGTPLRFGNPREARAAGFRVIYQEPEIIPGVDVAENIFAGELPRRGPFIDRQKLDRDARAELRRYGFERVLPADRMGDELSSAQRQLVEIMRAVKSPMHVLALDEPTSSLTDEEVDRLFTLVRRLRDEGVAIIYVSHRLREILRLADRVAVLRDGRLVTVRPASELTEREIVRLMVGRELGSVFQRHRTDPGPVILRATGIASDWHRDVSFEIRAGEIVGFAGLVGAGRTELAKVVFGELPRQSGTIEIGGRIAAVRTPDDAIRHGIGFAPEDRKREGLVLIRSVLENTTLAVLRRLTRFRILRQSAERRIAERYVRELNIRTPSVDQEVGKLSGGNQQKVVLSKALIQKPKLVIFDEPTRGVDVGTIVEIHNFINELADGGMAVVVISSYLPEVLALSDRILVARQGRIVEEMDIVEATESRIMYAAVH